MKFHFFHKWDEFKVNRIGYRRCSICGKTQKWDGDFIDPGYFTVNKTIRPFKEVLAGKTITKVAEEYFKGEILKEELPFTIQKRVKEYWESDKGLKHLKGLEDNRDTVKYGIILEDN